MFMTLSCHGRLLREQERSLRKYRLRLHVPVLSADHGTNEVPVPKICFGRHIVFSLVLGQHWKRWMTRA